VRSSRYRVAVFFQGIIGLCVPAARLDAAPYAARELQRPGSLQWIGVDFLTEDGRGIGYGRNLAGTTNHPIVWDRVGSPTFLSIGGTTGGGYAEGIDGAGRITGSLALGPDGNPVPVVWSGDSHETLPHPSNFGRAFGANGNVIVGHVASQEGRNVAAVWIDDVVHVLDQLPGVYSFGYRVNTSGTYVGITVGDEAGFVTYSGFVGNGASYHVLDLAGIAQPHTLDINDSGTIVGWWWDDLGYRHAFTVAENGDAMPVELGLLPGAVEGYAQGLNNGGTVTGINLDASFNETAVVYPNGSSTPTDMNKLIDPIPGVRLVRGIDVNESGQILVEGAAPDGYCYYILTPVPEPAIGAIGVLTVAALVSIRRSRRRGVVR
jgi:hypothetical protein